MEYILYCFKSFLSWGNQHLSVSQSLAEILLSCSYSSTLQDDLKLSTSEDSDGEQDPAKNTSRNTSAR